MLVNMCDLYAMLIKIIAIYMLFVLLFLSYLLAIKSICLQNGSKDTQEENWDADVRVHPIRVLEKPPSKICQREIIKW